MAVVRHLVPGCIGFPRVRQVTICLSTVDHLGPKTGRFAVWSAGPYYRYNPECTSYYIINHADCVPAVPNRQCEQQIIHVRESICPERSDHRLGIDNLPSEVWKELPIRYPTLLRVRYVGSTNEWARMLYRIIKRRETTTHHPLEWSSEPIVSLFR